ncbi:hypothetical protein [Ferruginibacter sp. HRS2-29]|uniref:hypothetical protein n=1 Tax=Ferruginibacter sp. HRS2-29 TaxID=2487334 RepID=UPI0020CF4FC5|nr:hypothetical protein [Ferruginibacter sp. HRS2-29]MCP9749776.1 hypothetical protein [Ferruginibacter sp. HRS2-29]
MRYKFFLYSILILVGSSCNNSSGYITVLLENNSDTRPAIEIVTNVSDTLYAKHIVKRNKEQISYTEFKITQPVKWDEIKLTFFVNGGLDTASCSIVRDSIKKNTTVHVNLNEVLFKKGDSYNGYTLDKDTVVKKQFYSEVIYK